MLAPLTVRSLRQGRYVLVSGHWRNRTAEIAGLAEAPCVVRDTGESEATIAMVDSSLQRETILPNERAFTCSMRFEVMKRQGQRTGLTSVQAEQKSVGMRLRGILAEELGTSEAKVQRCIRLTFLSPDLLAVVDAGWAMILPAVEVCYLAQDEQEHLLDAIEAKACTPSRAQAVKMKGFSKEGSLTPALIRAIMEEAPNQVEQVRIPKRSNARFFGPSDTKKEIERRTVRALSFWKRPNAVATSRAAHDGQRDAPGQGLLHVCGEHGVLRPRPQSQGQEDLLPDTLAGEQPGIGVHH